MLQEVFIWLFVCYASGTYIGWKFASKQTFEHHIEIILDKMIEDGYIKTKGTGENLELLKHWEKD
jgi:hypothetical protein